MASSFFSKNAGGSRWWWLRSLWQRVHGRCERVRPRKQRYRPGLEILEDRTVPAIIHITDLGDDTLANLAGDNQISLREALAIANNPGTTIDGVVSNDVADQIVFAVNGPILLSATAGQFSITQTVTITGNGAANTSIDAQQNSRIFDSTDTAGNVTLAGLTIKNGRTTADAEVGGAIRFLSAAGSTLTIQNSTLSGNSTSGRAASGGAIYADNEAVTGVNSTLSGNSTAAEYARGGAIYADAKAVTVTDSTLSGNSTTGYAAEGGAIYASRGALTVTNSTLSGNSTAGTSAEGGAIYAGSGAVTVTNSTLVQNQATNGAGGGIYSDSSPVTLRNSIVAQNTDNGTAPDLRPSPTDALTVSNSLIGNNLGTGLAAGNPDGNGNKIGMPGSLIDPLLGPLAFNGGPTQTHALLMGSPALDAGDNALATDGMTALTSDQRAATRSCASSTRPWTWAPTNDKRSPGSLCSWTPWSMRTTATTRWGISRCGKPSTWPTAVSERTSSPSRPASMAWRST